MSSLPSGGASAHSLNLLADHRLVLRVPGDRKVHRVGAGAFLPTFAREERPERERDFLPDRERPLNALSLLASFSSSPSPETSSGMSAHGASFPFFGKIAM